MKTLSIFILISLLSLSSRAIQPASDAFVGADFDLLVDIFGSGFNVRNGNLAESITINQQESGHLVMAALDGTGQMSWYQDFEGPFVYKEVIGPFMVALRVRVENKNQGQPLNSQFSAAGLLVRDPSSQAPGQNRWLAYNVGYQATGFARELKSTIDGPAFSASSLYLNDTADLHQELLVCRYSDRFYFYHRLAGESEWQEEIRTLDTVRMGNGVEIFNEPMPHPMQIVRTDMPQQLEVGILLNAWGGQVKQTYAAIDWIRFGLPLQEEDCQL